MLIVIFFMLTSCTAYDMTGVKDKMKNLGKNPCYNEETKVVEIGCNK